MSEITDIRSKKIIDVPDESAFLAIGAALGGELVKTAHAFSVRPWAPESTNNAIRSFNEMCAQNNLASVWDAAVVALDVLVEQQSMQSDAKAKDLFERAIREDLACPFCGQGDTRMVRAIRGSVHARRGHYVECMNCGATGPNGYADKVSARAGWAGLDRLPTPAPPKTN